MNQKRNFRNKARVGTKQPQQPHQPSRPYRDQAKAPRQQGSSQEKIPAVCDRMTNQQQEQYGKSLHNSILTKQQPKQSGHSDYGRPPNQPNSKLAKEFHTVIEVAMPGTWATSAHSQSNDPQDSRTIHGQ
ncbi:hypothetical protein Nepgr_020437 [Nepenthes gracilis]|uniref:Uncharacterized protein n=1 Tax=Nepenthes gracilis TaxID=150966 RepID=A0AAD3SXB0_NEPGR|nr:hypothetical protein Nepgr_020437 [Nepenthes gracilis]